MKVKLTLSIGFATGNHEMVIEIDDNEWECKTKEERESLLNELWDEWAWNYIEGCAKPLEYR